MEPTVKVRQGAPVRKADDKARFRDTQSKAMPDQRNNLDFEDEYGNEEERDELESVISNNYNQMMQ